MTCNIELEWSKYITHSGTHKKETFFNKLGRYAMNISIMPKSSCTNVQIFFGTMKNKLTETNVMLMRVNTDYRINSKCIWSLFSSF